MQVKIYAGSLKPTYRFGIPVQCKLSELSEIVQNAVKQLGELRLIEEITLEPTDSFLASRLKQIGEEGATIWKEDVRFEEFTHIESL